MSVIEKSGVMKYKDKDGQVYIMLPITTADKVDGAVSFYEQELTEEEKAQARANIGAISADEVPESGGSEQIQSDYDQNDSTAVDFIKNRPFYGTAGETIFDGDVTTTNEESNNSNYASHEHSVGLYGNIIEGDKVTIVYNGVHYPCVAKANMGEGIYLGNISIFGVHMLNDMATSFGQTVEELLAEDPSWEIYTNDTGEPFYLTITTDYTLFTTKESGIYHFTINKGEFKQLDEKFIPDTIARVSDIPQSDYNQNDSSAMDYIKNRPFYEIAGETIFDDDITTDQNWMFNSSELLQVNDGETVNVTIGNEIYQSVQVCEMYDGRTTGRTIGNKYLYLKAMASASGKTVEELLEFDSSLSVLNENTGETFLIVIGDDENGDVTSTSFIVDNAPNTTVHFTISTGDLKQLDEKFIPDTIARVSDIPTGGADIDLTNIPNLYTWKRYSSSPKEYTETENTEVIIGAAMGSQTSLSAYYTDNISIVDGAFDSNGFTDSGQTDITTLQELIKGKYVRYGTGNTGSPYKYYYIPEDVTLSYSYSGYNVVGVRADKVYLLGVNSNIGTFIDLVASEESNAYPTSGQHTDGYWYEYYKLLGSNGIYIGSGDMPEGCVIQIDPDGEYEGDTSDGSGSGKTLIGELELNSTNLTAGTQSGQYVLGTDLQTIMTNVFTTLNEGFDVLTAELTVEGEIMGTMCSYILYPDDSTDGTIYVVARPDYSDGSFIMCEFDATYAYTNQTEMISAVLAGDISMTVKFYTISGGSGSSSGDTGSDSSTQVQADYNQNDSTAADYIKNRPFYKGYGTIIDQDVTTALDEETFGSTAAVCDLDATIANNLTLGETYDVTCNNETYSCEVQEDATMMAQYLGNRYIYYSSLCASMGYAVEDVFPDVTDTGENFTVILGDGIAMFMMEEVGTFHLTIKGDKYHTLDPKFIDSSALLPNVSEDNDGQILGVEGGKWTNIDAPSSLPTVTTDDNDKVLMVVDGVWVAGSITNGDEVAY